MPHPAPSQSVQLLFFPSWPCFLMSHTLVPAPCTNPLIPCHLIRRLARPGGPPANACVRPSCLQLHSSPSPCSGTLPPQMHLAATGMMQPALLPYSLLHVLYPHSAGVLPWVSTWAQPQAPCRQRRAKLMSAATQARPLCLFLPLSLPSSSNPCLTVPALPWHLRSPLPALC